MEILWHVKLLVIFTGVLFAVRCQSDENMDLNWWKHSINYEVYPWSFKDSNGDGIGDIKGVTSKLDHFVDLGIDLIWMTPINSSPMVDFGYDVSNYTDINPLFGTMEDFDEMILEMKKRGIKFMLDLVPNHTSDEHIWFQKSINREEPYTDYYVWKDPRGFEDDGSPIVPNDWHSLFGFNTAWTWNEKREQFYYHVFSKQQPDLNFRNPRVIQEFKDIIRFWIERGVSGFRIDAPRHLMEDKLFRDEQENDTFVRRTVDLWETYEVIHELREYIDNEFVKKDGYTRILVPEVFAPLTPTLLYYDQSNYTISHYPFNFLLLRFGQYSYAPELNSMIRKWVDNMPKGATPNWVGGTHDSPRTGDSNGEEIIDIFNTLILLLPGIACPYYGQEIGMMGSIITPDQVKDTIVGRDDARTPMQWDDSFNAGFTNSTKPFLPVNTDYLYKNVEKQKSNETSHYNVFKRLSKLRKTETGKRGDLKTFIVSENVFAFSRSFEGHPTYIAFFNLNRRDVEKTAMDDSILKEKKSLKILVVSENAGYKIGDIIDFNSLLELKPFSCIVLGTIDSDEENSIKKGLLHSHKKTIFISGSILLLLASIYIITTRFI